MTALADEIRERIRRDGPIGVATYMELCLSHPKHGYYRRSRPIGASGDFITAPEVSQMFGELIGLWCAAVWQAMGQPQRVRLVELGPGRGTLLADTLRAARAVPAFRDAIDLHLVETNESLRAEQAARLADAHPTWHEGFETVPPGPALVVANEFFDALPIQQFERVNGNRGRSASSRSRPRPRHFASPSARLLPGSTVSGARRPAPSSSVPRRVKHSRAP